MQKSNRLKQVIVIGGGGFTKRRGTCALEKYILAQTDKKSPKVCFLPQASNEDQRYVAKFYETFLALGASPSWVSLFGSVTPSWTDTILQADVVYVGGGNTKSMIALWKAWGVDEMLRQAYENGVIMSGISAGMICWFEYGITDSVWPLGVVEGLGFLPGSCCPHFDSESERQDVYLSNVSSHKIPAGLALEDDVAAHFIDGKLHKLIKENDKKKAFSITPEGQHELHIKS